MAKFRTKPHTEKNSQKKTSLNVDITKQQSSHLNPEKLKELLEEIRLYVSGYDFDKAIKLSKRILATNSDDVKALEMRATIAIEMSDRKIALKYLNKAIAVQPLTGNGKYFSKAQLLSGEEALDCYKKGIAVIREEISDRGKSIKEENSNLNNSGDTDAPSGSGMNGASSSGNKADIMECSDDSSSSLENDMSCAYCAIAELYYTDLCDVPDAQELCVAAIKDAREADAKEPEAYITEARYLIIIDKLEEAKAVMTNSRALWLPDLPDQDQECNTLKAGKEGTAKVLIELRMHADAQQMLSSLVEDDEEVVSVQYLLGWNYYLQGDTFQRQARRHLSTAKMVEEDYPCSDEGMLRHIDELLVALPDAEDSDEEEDDSDEEDDEMDEEQLEKEILLDIAEAADLEDD